MLICPRCGCDTNVTDTYQEGKRVKRRRKCYICGLRFITIEKYGAAVMQGAAVGGTQTRAAVVDEKEGGSS